MKRKIRLSKPSNLGSTRAAMDIAKSFILQKTSSGGTLQILEAGCGSGGGIDLRGIKVKVDGDLDTDVLNGKRNDIRAGFSRICANVEIDADLTQEEKEAFIKEVDSRCPISDNIENLSKIDFVVR